MEEPEHHEPREPGCKTLALVCNLTHTAASTSDLFFQLSQRLVDQLWTELVVKVGVIFGMGREHGVARNTFFLALVIKNRGIINNNKKSLL